MSDDVLMIPPGRRVRFAAQSTEGDPGDREAWEVVRVVASRRPYLEGPSAMGRLLVAFRMAHPLREALAAIATSSDRAMGVVVERILDQPTARIREEDAEAGPRRGRPNASDEDEGFNQVVELQETGQAFSTQFVGHWVDQALYLSPAHVARIEALAREHGLSADEALDALIANHLAESLRER